MAILDAISPGQLQTFSHWLQVLEAEGVPDLPTARLLVSRKLHQHHRQLQRDKMHHAAGNRLEVCPDCGATMRYCSVTKAVTCRCGYSRMVAG